MRFGILHFLGCAALLYEAFRPLLRRMSRWGWLWLIPFFTAYFLLDRAFPFEHLWALGLRSATFSSTDYFPIFPWIFMYFFGVWLGGVISRGQMPDWFYRLRAPFFEQCGKHPLLIYIAHQPVLMAMTYAILFFMGRLSL